MKKLSIKKYYEKFKGLLVDYLINKKKKKHFLVVLTRCKNEIFIDDFVKHYLHEEVDLVHILDDDSTIPYSEYILTNPKVKIHRRNKKKFSSINKFAINIYPKIRHTAEYMIYCDVDEFITTRKNVSKTIKEELLTTFKNVDCIKIPWIMMNGKEKNNPNNLLTEITYRWDHDKKHPNKSLLIRNERGAPKRLKESISKRSNYKGKGVTKWRCLYEKIPCKCIFKTSKFKSIKDHFPLKGRNYTAVNSVNLKKCKVDAFYKNLREKDIKNAYLLCHHYRIVSIEQCINKLKFNKYYNGHTNTYALEELLAYVYLEIKDDTLRIKTLNRELKQN